MKLASKIAFDVLLLTILATFLILALGYNNQARMIPLVLGVPGFVLMLAQTYLDIGKWGIDAQENRLNTANPTRVNRKEATIIGWFLCSVLLLYLAGFPIGLSLFTFLYLKVKEKFSWKLSVGVTIVIYLFISIGFMRLLQTDLYKGLLFSLARQ